MNRDNIIEKYRGLGLEIEEGTNEPGYVYEPHMHETTYLWTVAGSIMIKKGDTQWQIYTAGEECVIADGELHEAKVGPDGWTYIAGWNPVEAEKYPD